MRIRRLKLAGFKSFVEPAELHIEPGLTGVVGPNGCGKSNLLEAIRWLMGEGSAKSLRGGGMDDVIFAGTANRPSRDHAEVQMLVEDVAGQPPGEIEVVRRIERGAGSAYRINGRDVRQKDVALLFADAATGAHSPALVSQGRIAAVIAAKPAERRQMLEEAAGIAGLHVRRKDAEQKLRATEANLTRLDEVVADMEGRANALRRQARAAERYRQLSDRIRTAEARTIFARWREAAEAADQAKKEAAVAEALVATAAEAQRDANALSGEATRRLAEARSAAEQARETALALGHRLQTLATERQTLTARLAELGQQRETLARDRAREGSLANDAAEALERLKVEQADLERDIAEAETGRAARRETLAEAERGLRDAEVALSQALAAQAAEQADARVTRAALATAQERLRRAEADVARLERDIAGIEAAGPIEARRDAAREAQTAADRAAEAARAALARADADREAAAAARATAEAAVSAANATLAALRSEQAAIAKVVNSGARDANAVIAQLTVTPGYERALAASLGDDLNASVTPSGARRWTGADIETGDPILPPGVTALATVVTAPPQLARRLAQVGVVDTDDGAALAAGQRLVTRDGMLRRWDGYVSSGEGAAAADRLIRVNRLAEIERARPEAEATVSTAQGEAAAARNAITAATNAAQAARTALTQAEETKRRAARDEDTAQGALERIEARRADLAERAGRAAAEQAEAQAVVARAAAAVAALPDAAAAASRVASLGDAARAERGRVAAQTAELTGFGERIERQRARSVAAKAEAQGWRTRAGDAARRIAEMAKRVEAAEAEVAKIADRPTVLAAEIAEVEAQAGVAKAAAEAAREAERAAEAALRAAEDRAAKTAEALATAREARAGAIARAENQEQRRVETSRLSGERFDCPAVVLPEKIGFDSAGVTDAASEGASHDRLVAERDRLGPVNLVAERELTELEAEIARNTAERQELGEAVNRLRGSIGSLNREGRARLTAAFEAVDGHFRRLFTTLFDGGQAHLALVDSDDPLEAGLEIMAQPPGKKLGSLTLLSGGEQALTAVALIFGLFLTNPAPICVLDEVDAPLDDANVERFCDLLDRMVRETETRYLIVTHNAVTMSRMHRLFGVTMVERGVSRLVSVDLGGAERLLAAE